MEQKNQTAIQLGDLIESSHQFGITHDEALLNKPTYLNTLSSREMDSLTAFCDTIWPSLQLSADKDDPALYTYYTTSASMAGTPQLVGGFMSQRLKHPMVFVMRIALWMLSTWIGTIAMCGIPSLSTQFPYVQTFSQVSHKKRQQILASWSSSYFYLLRMLFYALKFMVVLIFFTQVDENNENLSWKAVGYCGPDPAFLSQTKPSKSPHTDEINELYGPLHRGLIDPGLPRQVLAETLKQSGFPLSIHHRKPKPSSISSPSLTLHCDALVVGSGSGGGVAAAVLAKAGYKVLLLEKGNYYARSSLSLLEGQSVDQMYQGGGLLATKDLSVIVLAGSTVGGGSTINWSASIKTPKHVLNEWCDHYGLEIFKSESYKEAMQVVCDRMGVQSHIHDRESLNNSVLRKGCDELGYPVSNIPRNSPPDHYCGWCCLGCKDGKKKGVAETWLVDMVESGNGLILPGCEALKVLHVRKKATGVAFKFGKDICLVKSKVVIVAGGALGTPALLKNSEMSNANIGKHLHLHPVTMAWGYFPDSVTKSYEGGIMTAMSSVVAEFHGSGYGAIIQTPSLHPGMFSALTPWTSGVNMKERMRKFSKTAHVFALARDVGEGEVSTVSSLSYKIDKRDEKSIQKGLEKVLRILAAAGAEEIGTQHRNGKTLNVKKVSSHVFEKFVKEESGRGIRNLDMPVCSAHQMGSCRMGLDPKTSVVKENGETWEIEGLYLADSSVFPTALGVNPMVTIQAIAYCTAQSVVEVLKRKKKGC